MFMRDIGFCFFFRWGTLVFAWGNSKFIKSIRSGSSIFWKRLYRSDINTAFLVLAEFSSKTIWAWRLHFWEFKNYIFSFLKGYKVIRASLVAQLVKNPPVMWETWVWSLGWEAPLEEGLATHSSSFAWRSTMDRWAWRAPVHGVSRGRAWLSNQADTRVCLQFSVHACGCAKLTTIQFQNSFILQNWSWPFRCC